MNAPSRYSAVSHVLACDVADEAVLLDTQAGLYFGLDPVGARIWSLLAAGHSATEICDRLEADFDVSRERLEADVRRFIADLAAQRLIQAAA